MLGYLLLSYGGGEGGGGVKGHFPSTLRPQQHSAGMLEFFGNAPVVRPETSNVRVSF